MSKIGLTTFLREKNNIQFRSRSESDENAFEMSRRIPT